MDQPTKKQKFGDSTSINSKEEVLFNSDTLSKIISFMPSIDILSLALTCKRFSASKYILTTTIEPSLIEESVRIAIQDIATDERLAALPHYDKQNSLADYHYLQLMREPLTFDQLVGAAYVNSDDKSRVRHSGTVGSTWETAFSNNILRAGKHFVSFEVHMLREGAGNFWLGIMRPGKANENARSLPESKQFFQNFTRRDMVNGECNKKKNVNYDCCFYNLGNGYCHTKNWQGRSTTHETWDGLESMSSGDEVGLLLDLDDGTLTVYKNRKKLGVMRRGLVGQYCWAVSMYRRAVWVHEEVQVTIKRGTIPPS